jgi:hypothetical protein
MANVTLPTYYFNTAILNTVETTISVLEPTVIGIYQRPTVVTAGQDPDSVVVTNKS